MTVSFSPVVLTTICLAVSACRFHRRSQVEHSGPLVEQARALRAESQSGQGQNRTAHTVIFSHVLYQLSYLAPDENADS